MKFEIDTTAATIEEIRMAIILLFSMLKHMDERQAADDARRAPTEKRTGEAIQEAAQRVGVQIK